MMPTAIQLFSTNFFHIIDGTLALPDFKNKTYKYRCKMKACGHN
jgi:hypothetical protein